LSRQRSAARAVASRELIRELLRHGARFVEPCLEVVEAAEWLAGLGLVALHRGRAVRCANWLDPDFPPPMRDCDGLIALRPEADGGGGDYRCPECERIVFPEADRKQEFDTLGVQLRQAGIEAFLISACGELASGRSFVGGVLTLSVQQINAAVCLVDYCSEAHWLGRGFGINQRCVYVTVGPEVAPRILREDAVAHVELVDVLLGLKDLPATIIERVSRLPAALANVDPLVYALGARPIASEPENRPGRHIFHVWLSPAGFLVDGLLALRATRTTANLIMRVLTQRLTDAIRTGGSLQPMSADDLADAVEEITGDVQDADTIRRQISRMRKDITDTIHRTGTPIGEHDIIETVSRSGAEAGGEGYRLNPATVALMHFEG
jgi:hypothetical protein